MGQNQKARYSLALVISLSSSFTVSQKQLPANPDTRLDEERANDMHRGLSREDQQRNEEIEAVSPIRRIGRNPNPVTTEMPTDPAYRSIDGSGNNQRFRDMNSHGAPLRRWLAADYVDGISALAAPAVAGPREISNAVAAQTESIPNSMGTTDFFWQWGQFLDHDFALTDGVEPAEHANIVIPAGDNWFDPENTGEKELEFNRSLYEVDSGTGSSNPRQQLNEITGWIDASNVYGSDIERAAALRAFDGNGYLIISEGGLLPYNVDGLANAGGVSEQMFLAGDVRANEQVGLTVMHTLFVREHNRLIDQNILGNPSVSGEQAYQQARQIVGAQMQVISYQEFLPLLLGEEALPAYQGYQPDVDARIANSFSTAAYRLGHSLIGTQLLRLDENLEVIEVGNLPLRNAFFSPSAIEETGIDPVLRGLARQVCQELDPYEVDDIRNFLFGAPGSDGFDLVSLNIQRGRDHGLPGYNQAREVLGLEPASSFSDITSNVELQQQLASVYDNVDQVDLWVGGLSEDHVDGAMVGELLRTILVHQFTVLRDGDRFWYQNRFNSRQVEELQHTSLADIIRRNTDIGAELPDNVFQAGVSQERNQRPDRQGDNRRNGNVIGN
jgi:peroxidase